MTTIDSILSDYPAFKLIAEERRRHALAMAPLLALLSGDARQAFEAPSAHEAAKANVLEANISPSPEYVQAAPEPRKLTAPKGKGTPSTRSALGKLAERLRVAMREHPSKLGLTARELADLIDPGSSGHDNDLAYVCQALTKFHGVYWTRQISSVPSVKATSPHTGRRPYVYQPIAGK